MTDWAAVISRTPRGALVQAVRSVLGGRVVSLVAYGSGATGDVLPGYSDFDCMIVVSAPVGLPEILDLQRAVGQVGLAPFSYYQPTFFLGRPRRAVLVPRSYVVLAGEPPGRDWLYGPAELRENGEKWLAGLPGVLSSDAADFALATAPHLPRQARRELTRVKPSLRALLVRAGTEPVQAWTTTWADLQQGITALDARLGDLLAALLDEVRARHDREVAAAALRLLAAVCTQHLDGVPDDWISPR
jgi:hypothetical protein